jgi:hypothetical protein
MKKRNENKGIKDRRMRGRRWIKTLRMERRRGDEKSDLRM